MKRLFSIDWRREAIYPLTAAMEVAWFTPWYLSLLPATARLPAPRAALGLFVTMVIPVYAARLLDRLRLKLWLRQLTLVLLLILTCLLSLRVLLYSGGEYSGFDWLSEAVKDALDLYQLLPDWLVIVLSTLFLWWRGISLGRRRPSVRAVVMGFYFGIFAFVGFVLIVSVVTGQDPSAFIPVFFFLSLVALGATRMEEMRERRGAIRSPFGLSWLGLIALAALVVVGFGTALGNWLTGGDLRNLVLWLEPILLLVGILLGLFLFLLRIGVNGALRILGALGLEQAAEPLDELLEGLRDLGSATTGGELEVPPGVTGAASVARLLLSLAVLVGLGGLVIWMLRQQGRVRRERSDDQEHETLLSAQVLADNLRQLVDRSKGRLASALGLLGRAGLQGLFAAFTIRRIYAQMLRLAATQGYPRAAFETPYEYEGTAARAFPDAHDEVRAITEAYVAVHYGEVPETKAELQRIQACWERIKASARNK